MQQKIKKTIKQKMADAYGSRSGCLRSYWYKLLYFMWLYQGYRRVDWKSVERLVFVCKGNICRSAFAEAVATSDGIEAVSCGLDTVDAAPANIDAIEAAGKIGFDLEPHRTTMISSLTFYENDLFVVMEPWQAEYLKNEFSGINHCTLLGLWKSPVLPYIHDPYGASTEYFDNCFEYIKKSVHEITGQIKAQRS